MSRLVDCVFFNGIMWLYFFFFKQKTAYEVRISDWSSDVCSSDLRDEHREAHPRIDRDHPACRDRRAEEGELEMLVGPDAIGVEDFLIGEQRNREHRDERENRENAKEVGFIHAHHPRGYEIEHGRDADAVDRTSPRRKPRH